LSVQVFASTEILIIPSSEAGNNIKPIRGARKIKVSAKANSGSVRAKTLDFLLAINFHSKT